MIIKFQVWIVHVITYDNQILSMEKVSCVKCLLSLSKGKRMDLINLNMQVQVIEFHKDV